MFIFLEKEYCNLITCNYYDTLSHVKLLEYYSE